MSGSLNDYADNMFRFERLHPRWIDSCARYLRHAFGAAIEGKVFLDYAFGRGNWSLAALKAGARQVVAVDAAVGNVRRFADFCKANEIGAVDIVHGNVVDQPLQVQADIIWTYGILHHIAEPGPFVGRLSELRRDDRALALFYAYDRRSLREVIVEAARRGIVYRSEREFAEDSYLFSPRARMRARDDLTAPVVVWYTASELSALVASHGWRVQRQLPDFRNWLTQVPSHEFSPHHLLCTLNGARIERLVEAERHYAHDLPIVADLARAVIAYATSAQRRSIAIGLFNTHFSALPTNGAVEPAIAEDFLYLMHAALRLGVSAAAFDAAGAYYDAAVAATTDAPRRFSETQLARSPLARFLDANTIRF